MHKVPQQYHHTDRGLRRDMSTGPDPLDIKYAPGAELARQHVMVGVSVAMTCVGG
jgi:hypothetical protein